MKRLIYLWFILIGLASFVTSCSPQISKMEYNKIKYENQQLQKQNTVLKNKLEKIEFANDPDNVAKGVFDLRKYQILQAKYEQLLAAYKRLSASDNSQRQREKSYTKLLEEYTVLKSEYETLLKECENDASSKNNEEKK